MGKCLAAALLQPLRRLRSRHALLSRPWLVPHAYSHRQSNTNGRTLLYFEGAGQTSHVYVGNTLAGTHVGGYDEFVFDITDAVAALAPRTKSGIPIAVLCDNSEDLERSPSDLSDFSLYGGLYRHVHLAYVPAVSLEAVHIAPTFAPGSPARVKVKARLYNPANFPATPLAVEIADASGQTIAQIEKSLAAWSDETEIASFSDRIAGALVARAAPSLHMQRHARPLIRRELSERALRHSPRGVRRSRPLQAEWRAPAAARHAAPHGSRRLRRRQPDALIRDEMELVKAMGANFIRLGHYQQSRLVLDLCDELGLLVWEEAPWCRSGIGDEKWKQQTRTMLANMIDQHFNHPCILMWGLGNEDDWPGEYPALDQAGDSRLHAGDERPRARAGSVALHLAPPLRFCARYPRCLFAVHLGRLV